MAIAVSEYTVTLGGQSFKIMLQGGNAIVDGRKHTLDADFTGADSLSLIIDGAVSHAHLVDSIPSKILDLSAGIPFKICVDDNVFDVMVDTRRSLLLKSLTPASQSKMGPTEIRAPMPGLVSKIEVSVGDPIEEGRGLVILEAMKMENEIRAHSSGRVEAIRVKSGQPVEKGEVLIVIVPIEQ